MSSAFRTGVRVGSTRPGVFCVVAVALTLELLARVAVGVFSNPFVAVLLPPFLGVVVLGGAFPVVRAAAAEDDAPWVAFPATVGARWPSLLAFAAVGHLAALVVGTGLFLVCDTAIRFPLYAVVGEHLPAGFAPHLPAAGVGGGALVAWSLLPAAMGPLLDEENPRPGLRAGLRSAGVAAVAAPGRTAFLLGLHVVAVVAVVGAAAAGIVYTGGPSSLLHLVVLGGGLALLAGTALFQFVYPVHVATSLTPAGGVTDGLDEFPARRVAVAVLLCLSLVAGAGAVRATETRPVDTAPEPLPDDPSSTYAVALENTERADHVYLATANVSDEDRTTSRRVSVDRTNRRYLDETVTATPELTTRTALYATTGVAAYDTRSETAAAADSADGEFANVHAGPAYWTVVDGAGTAASEGSRLSLPTPGTGEWSVANRSDGRVTLVLTGEAAYEAVYGHAPPSGQESVEGARLQVVVDTDRGVVSGGEATIRTVRADGPGTEVDAAEGDGSAAVTPDTENATRRVAQLRYEVSVDTAVRRPDRLGPTPGEWAWRLFTY